MGEAATCDMSKSGAAETAEDVASLRFDVVAADGLLVRGGGLAWLAPLCILPATPSSTIEALHRGGGLWRLPSAGRSRYGATGTQPQTTGPMP